MKHSSATSKTHRGRSAKADTLHGQSSLTQYFGRNNDVGGKLERSGLQSQPPCLSAEERGDNVAPRATVRAADGLGSTC
eukprot:SAG31_NODE_16141_length_721_cov_1.239550_1_plen_78_part_01